MVSRVKRERGRTNDAHASLIDSADIDRSQNLSDYENDEFFMYDPDDLRQRLIIERIEKDGCGNQLLLSAASYSNGKLRIASPNNSISRGGGSDQSN